RAVNSDVYSRVWNHEIFDGLAGLREGGWRVPPARPAHEDDPRARPAAKADGLQGRKGGGGGARQGGGLIAPGGGGAGEPDMFAFLVNEEYRIDDGTDGGLSRGVFVSNSEVGAGALRLTCFLYRHVCGNHIVWGAEHVFEVVARHVGGVQARFDAEVGGHLG